jgi:alkylhydroperoxidase/carboxymuconolactone decarboxylase family protein YurZ
MEDRIKEILEILEDAISYEDWSQAEEARKELLFILEDLESDFPTQAFEEDF